MERKIGYRISLTEAARLHTNFPVTEADKRKTEHIVGVSSVTNMTPRYVMWVIIGEMFDQVEVITEIAAALDAEVIELPPEEIEETEETPQRVTQVYVARDRQNGRSAEDDANEFLRVLKPDDIISVTYSAGDVDEVERIFIVYEDIHDATEEEDQK